MSNPESLFEDIKNFVTDSRSLLGDGAVVELAGLDNEVEKLCTLVLELSTETREKYADYLQELLTELTALGEDLVTKRDALQHEIRYLSSHKKANIAYKTVDATGAKKESE